MRRSRSLDWIRASMLVAAMVTCGALALAQPEEEPQLARDATLRGTIQDPSGAAVANARVILRIVGDTEVYVSPPSDAEGRFEVAVPSGFPYDVVAILTEAGERIELPEEELLRPDAQHALRLPVAPGAGARLPVARDHRLFLSFAEDPATVERRYAEGRVDYLDFEGFDAVQLQGLFAVQFISIPDVEVGVRAGFATTDLTGDDESGPTDAELWAKLRFHRSPMGRNEWAFGGIVTLPTGDEEAGIGQDAIQSKLFVAGRRGFASARLIGHVGVRMTENGEIAGIPLESTVSPTAGLGLLAPATPKITVALEASYDGERFEDTEDDARLFAGVDWAVSPRGTFRAGSSIGLVDEAPEAQIVVGFGYSF